MATPPSNPKAPAPPEDLAEVERALSVLHGRHPEHERVRREDQESRDRRQAEIDERSTREARRVRSRRALLGAGALVVGTIAVLGAIVFRSELARRGRIEQAGDPYRALGFVLVETTSRGEPSKLEAKTAAGCVLAAASTGPGTQMRLTHAGGTIEGAGPILTCLCEAGQVTVSADMKPGEGLVLLRNEASAFGGSSAFAFLPFKAGTTGRTDQACAEASLDAWIDAKRWTQESPEGTARPLVTVDAATTERWFAAEPKRAPLRAAGFAIASVVKKEAPFAVVEVPAETCVLVAPEREADRSSLRLRSGVLAIGPANANVLWCTSAATLVLAQREGTGELTVLSAPAARAGGLEGARAAAESAGLTLGAATVPAGDRGWSAKKWLLASAVPETLVTSANTPELGANDPAARIVALSLDRPGALVAETQPEVFSFCDPPIDKATSSLCVFSGPQRWRMAATEANAGLARAKMPFWLFGLEEVSEPAALKLEVELVVLARRLRLAGFEPTTIEAVTEVDKGVEVLGRANEDAIVAVGLSKSAPWIFPYTDGPAWTLDGEPRVVPIQPLERVTVTTKAKPLPPKATRHTVVFRRQKR